ncbi:MAG: hypothetical protein K8R23_02615 [Chthoniobacter sp.]|nr:hypothetical protein [Chthoniobacter sp.]
MNARLGILWQYLLARGRFTRWRDRSAFEAWQEKMTLRHLARVAEKSPHFGRLAREHGIARWRQWPLTGKAAMMQHFDDWNTVGIRLDDAWKLALDAERTRDFSATLHGITVGLSSGTSGSRGVFLASAAERRLWAGTLLARVLRGTLRCRHRAALFLRADSPLYQTLGSRRFRFEFFDLLQPLEEQWPRLRALRPTILAAPPRVLAHLASHPDAAGLLAPPHLLLSVADVLDETDRTRIEGGFRTPPGQIYQATEGFLAATCPHGRLHWNEDAVVIEKQWLDAGRTRYAPVITDFRRLTQPIIRYRLDDVVVADDGAPCRCGSVFGTLAAIEGRCDDALLLPKVDGPGEVTVFPDFVRRAIILSIPTGVDYAVVQTGSAKWTLALSRECPLEPVQGEVDRLCRQLGARPPMLERVPWVVPPLTEKRRRVRCVLHA